MARAMEELRTVQPALLELHKALLDAERAEIESVHGAMSGPEFLQLISDPVRYGWLKPFSRLLVAIDDALNPSPDEPEKSPQELLDEARSLVLPPNDETPFGHRYLALMQRDPGLVMAHSAATKALGRESLEAKPSCTRRCPIDGSRLVQTERSADADDDLFREVEGQ